MTLARVRKHALSLAGFPKEPDGVMGNQLNPVFLLALVLIIVINLRTMRFYPKCGNSLD